ASAAALSAELGRQLEDGFDTPGNAGSLFDGDTRSFEGAGDARAGANGHRIGRGDVALDRALDDDRSRLNVGLDLAALDHDELPFRATSTVDRSFAARPAVAPDAAAQAPPLPENRRAVLRRTARSCHTVPVLLRWGTVV